MGLRGLLGVVCSVDGADVAGLPLQGPPRPAPDAATAVAAVVTVKVGKGALASAAVAVLPVEVCTMYRVAQKKRVTLNYNWTLDFPPTSIRQKIPSVSVLCFNVTEVVVVASRVQLYNSK